MPLVETLESYSRALYLPLRGYVRRPFQFVTESIREHVPRGLWDIRRAMEQTVLGSSKLVGPFDGFISGNSLTNNGSGIGGNAGAGAAGSMLGGASGSTAANAASAAATAASAASAASGSGLTGAGSAAARMLQVQPSLIQFFTSPYCLLLCFLVSVINDGRRGRKGQTVFTSQGRIGMEKGKTLPQQSTQTTVFFSLFSFSSMVEYCPEPHQCHCGS